MTNHTCILSATTSDGQPLAPCAACQENFARIAGKSPEQVAAHVVSLESRLNAGTQPTLTVPRAEPCYPHTFKLDRVTRIAHCSRCKRGFDAFDAMVYLAEHWGDFQGNRETIKQEMRRLEERRDELREEKKRLEGFVRRRVRSIAEVSPHATKCLELLLRIYRSNGRDTLSSDRIALNALLREVEQDARIVSTIKPLIEKGASDA